MNINVNRDNRNTYGPTGRDVLLVVPLEPRDEYSPVS